VVSACDSGEPIVQFDKQSHIAESFNSVFVPLLQKDNHPHLEKEVKVQ
jgi:hypothetical protein